VNRVVRLSGANRVFRAYWDDDALTFSPAAHPGWLIPWLAVWRHEAV